MKTLGILGGMGPLATTDFMRQVLKSTYATRDQEHIPMVVENNTKIPDRTAALIHEGESPIREMIRSAIRLEAMGADFIAMPCNTAHGFYEDVQAFVDIPVLHMIQETVGVLLQEDPDRKTYGLLATTGTYETGLYQNAFQEAGLELVLPDPIDQQLIMDLIYDLKAGVVSSRAKVEGIVHRMTAQDPNMPLILGCTELPVIMETLQVDHVFVNPTEILAKACVRMAQGQMVADRAVSDPVA